MQSLSHEGRNTLQKAQAHIALLRMHLEENSEALDLVQKIEDSQEKLLELYEEVKSYAGPILLHPQPYSLQSMVEKAWARCASSAESARFSLILDTKDLTCEIDVDAMTRVLGEVLKNALAASNEAVEIQISVDDDELEGLPAKKLVVSDNGYGVPVEDWEKAFQPFYTTKTHGTGLGLAVSRRFVAGHNGRIQFGPPQLGGASVYITLPQRSSSAEGTAD